MQDQRRVLSAKEMAHIEELSFQEGASAESYMDKAAEGIYHLLMQRVSLEDHIIALIGKGHNGADTLGVATHLLKAGYSATAYAVTEFVQCAALCQKKWRAFEEAGGKIYPISELNFGHGDLILDGLLGTGFKGDLCSPYLEVIKQANSSKLPIYSIDIPSGLNGTTGEPCPIAIHATETFALGTYKFGFFIRDGFNHVGKLSVVDFGLPEKYLERAHTLANVVDETKMAQFLPPIKRNRHKYEAGLVLALAGSPGMPGAALLAVKAAYRSGAGIVKLFHSKEASHEFGASSLELVRLTDWELFLEQMWHAKALLIGPGMGRSHDDKRRFDALFNQLTLPTVIDADGLFHLGTQSYKAETPLILTPHRKEMMRLLGEGELEDEALIEGCEFYAREHNVTLILKGAPTWIFHPGLRPMVALKGDPGMATAGTGDVLTGILAALFAQGLTAINAAILGTHLHGLAGELAAKRLTSYSLTASDLIGYLPIAFHSL